MSDDATPQTRSIAGHTFDLRGLCVASGCALPSKRLSEILSATRENLDQEGWAHYGKLNERELVEIEAERERIWKAHAA